MNLFDIAAEYRQAIAELSDLDLPDDAVKNTLDGIKGDLQAKSINVAAFVRQLDASAQAIDEAIKQMQHRKHVIENRASGIRDYIKKSMDLSGISKIECPWFVLSIKKNPPKVFIDDVDSVPVAFMRLPEPPIPEPDKKLIAAALKDGNSVPGAHLEQGTQLVIK